MGKLLALELFNFKSYKGHHVLQFGDSYFTSIIGPNGSGKSNSMDAISFVLGIKSSHLRSAHLEDLIYRGRVLKHAKIADDGTAIENGDGEANGEAAEDYELGTQTSIQRNDPQTAWVMAVYEDDAGDVQRWKRSITASGASEYRINNRVVTAKQYNDALEGENILIRARNFLVFQGDVEAIASQSPTDLTRLIEQISGSLEYKKDYDRLRAEKDAADDEVTHRAQMRRGIKGEVTQYQAQKAELDEYEKLQDKRDQLRVTHVLWRLFHLQRTIEDSTAEIQKHQEELKEFRRNVKKYDDRLEKAKGEQANIGREMHRYERQVKKTEKTIQEKEHELVPIDEQLSITRRKIKERQRVFTDISAEGDSQQQSVDKFRADIAKVKKAQKHWETEWQAQQQQQGRQLSQNDLREYQRLRAEVSKRSGYDQLKKENIERQIKVDESTVDSLKSKSDSYRSSLQSLETEEAELTARLNQLKASTKSTSKEIEQKKKQIHEKTSERERARQKHSELEQKLTGTLKLLEELRGAEQESKRDAQQREWYGQLKRLYPTGVKGFIRNLCKPKQKKYETAIATVFGRHWDAIIVDTSKTAQDCCQYLKDNALGRMMFIPLDTVVHEQPSSNMRGMQQGVRLAIDTIDYDTGIERAVSYVCGSTVVTDTLDIARKLCYEKGIEVKAVALDGTVIHRGGNMTGGVDPSDRNRRFQHGDVEELHAMAQNYAAEIEKLPPVYKNKSEEDQLQSELSGLEEKLRYVEDEIKTLERNIDSKARESAHLRQQLKELKPKLDQEMAGLQSLRRSLDEHTSVIAGVEDEIFGVFCQRIGYANIRDYDAQQGSMQAEAEVKASEFTAQISRLENRLHFDESRLKNTRSRIAATQAEIKRDERLVNELEKQKAQLTDELDVVNASVEEANEQLATLRGEYEERGKVVTQARDELRKRSTAVEKTLKTIADLQAGIETASASRHTILRSCRVENVDIPLEEGSRKLNAVPVDDELLEEEADEDAMDIDGEEGTARPKFNDFGVHVDFSDLDEDLKEDSSDGCETRLLEKISNITADLEKKSPNMRSADRLQATQERFRAMEREYEAARAAAQRANRAFEAVKKQRMERFNRAFAHISEQIGPVYRELTKTESFPLGGQATLGAEEGDEDGEGGEAYLGGVKYHAMPPLKRFRDMELLSGGEKTMAALALLFAVHAFAPSPFFVLDEVDAALDNANTAQLAAYLRAHAAPNMQFIVISLKTGLFQNSETLVGVMRDQSVNSSKALTLDLRKYQAVV